MLSEQRRQQLDGIVKQMIVNKEKDANVQFVVNDFIKKYGNETEKVAKPKITTGDVIKEIPGTVGNMLVGAGKGVLSTLSGASELGQRALNATVGKVVGQQQIAKLPEKFTEATNTAQKIGKGIEQAAEYLVPGTTSVKLGAVAKAAVGGKLGGIAGLATRALAEAGLVGGTTAIQEGEAGQKAKTAALIGGAVPVVGKLATAPIKKTGSVMKNVGETIQTSLIKPSKRDLEDGFNIANVKKYNIGGNLSQMLEKTESRLYGLTQQLKEKVSRSNAIIDLNEVAKKTAEDISKGKSSLFGYNAAAKRTLETLAQEIENVSANGLVDLVEAQVVKQAAGKQGAWVYGFMDRDAKAAEVVYTRFYQHLKKEIEQKAPAGVREINKQLSELIPISHAILRRIPVATRNNALSINDLIATGFATVDPKAWAIVGVNRLTKSGKFADLLTKVGEGLPKTVTPTSGIGKRIFGD